MSMKRFYVGGKKVQTFTPRAGTRIEFAGAINYDKFLWLFCLSGLLRIFLVQNQQFLIKVRNPGTVYSKSRQGQTKLPVRQNNCDIQT